MTYPTSPARTGPPQVWRHLLAMLAVLLLPGALPALAANDLPPYVVDGSGQPMRSGQGLCWRTGYWSPGAAEASRIEGRPAACTCDPDLMPSDACLTVAERPVQPRQASAPAAAAVSSVAPPPVSTVTGPVKVKLSAEAKFRFNTSVLEPESRRRLDALAEELAGVELEVVLAVGHADRIGPAAYNQEISEKRAAEVKAYLIGKGIPAQQIYTEGKGETQPAHLTDCQNLGPESSRNRRLVTCLEADRRVEIEAIGIR
ncbi:MAG: OmpA family protein [Rhodocyclaceae bacterium]|nr:OmpA family protein [Rhodocyclaceae bacterium]